MASLRCAAMMRSMRPRVSPAAMRSMGSYGPSTDSQPNSVDNKFSSDRLDKVRAFSLPKWDSNGLEGGNNLRVSAPLLTTFDASFSVIQCVYLCITNQASLCSRNKHIKLLWLKIFLLHRVSRWLLLLSRFCATANPSHPLFPSQFCNK